MNNLSLVTHYFSNRLVQNSNHGINVYLLHSCTVGVEMRSILCITNPFPVCWVSDDLTWVACHMMVKPDKPPTDEFIKGSDSSAGLRQMSIYIMQNMMKWRSCTNKPTFWQQSAKWVTENHLCDECGYWRWSSLYMALCQPEDFMQESSHFFYWFGFNCNNLFLLYLIFYFIINLDTFFM